MLATTPSAATIDPLDGMTAVVDEIWINSAASSARVVTLSYAGIAVAHWDIAVAEFRLIPCRLVGEHGMQAELTINTGTNVRASAFGFVMQGVAP